MKQLKDHIHYDRGYLDGFNMAKGEFYARGHDDGYSAGYIKGLEQFNEEMKEMTKRLKELSEVMK